jgi:hypothetical protein
MRQHALAGRRQIIGAIKIRCLHRGLLVGGGDQINRFLHSVHIDRTEAQLPDVIGNNGIRD